MRGFIFGSVGVLLLGILTFSFFYEDKNYVKTSEYVVMEDGTKLAVDIYLPENRKDNEKHPVIFQYTPYGRAYIVPEASLIEKIGMKFALGTLDPVLDRGNSNGAVYGSTKESIQMFIDEGYAYVAADMRGTGASFGTKIDFDPQFPKDGKELIDWIGSQAWSSNKVGMYGGSYLGYSQLVTASTKPEALKAIMPEVAPIEGYSTEIRPGGVLNWAYSQNDLQQPLERNQYMPDKFIYPTAPVIDEDGDGDLTDEIPIDKNGNGSFLDDYNYPENQSDTPKYRDGNDRQHVYFLATKEHMPNIPYKDIGPSVEFIDTKFGNETTQINAYEGSPGAYMKGLSESGVAIYSHGGWMDPFATGTTELYATLEKTNPSKMVMDAGYHLTTSPYWKEFGVKESDVFRKLDDEMLKFFDFYVKGVDNGFDKEPPVLLYNMNGDGWRHENEWPLARQQEQTLYFNSNNKLGTEKQQAGSKTQKAQLDHDASWPSVWGDGYKANRWMMDTPAELPVRTELDKKAFTYTSAPVTKDTEVTGHPIIELWASSTANTGDFFVYLEDVDENGKAVLVTEGIHNAEFSELHNNDMKILGGSTGINVLPELPWHGYEKKHSNPKIFANGNIAKLKFDLLATSWVFKEGHSMRISIASADWPTFQITPELSPTNNPHSSSTITPDITIYNGEQYPSSVTLPIIPRK